MQKLFSHTFSQNIWRIFPHPDAQCNHWALELREISEKKVSFAIIDLDKGELRWQNTPEATDWWTSLTAFSYRHLLLHNYRYPDLPQPTDLLAVSAADGILSWLLPNYVLVKTLDEDSLEVSARVGDKFISSRCHADSGLLSTLPDENYSMREPIILKQPVRYKEGNIYFEKLAAFLLEILQVSRPVCIDYLDQRPYMIFSYYIYQQEKILQHLLIVTNQKEIIFQDQLSEGRDGVGESTMLMKNSVLIYLKNNNEFSSLTL